MSKNTRFSGLSGFSRLPGTGKIFSLITNLLTFPPGLWNDESGMRKDEKTKHSEIPETGSGRKSEE